MGVGLTGLGHLWTGRRRRHTHYVIGDPRRYDYDCGDSEDLRLISIGRPGRCMSQPLFRDAVMR
jgi:hypothetical protein